MVNGTSNTSASVTMDDEQLGDVSNFKCLQANLSKGITYNAEVYTWIGTAAMARLKRISKRKSSHHTKFKLYKLRVVSIFIYGCVNWKILVETGKTGSGVRG